MNGAEQVLAHAIALLQTRATPDVTLSDLSVVRIDENDAGHDWHAQLVAAGSHRPG